MNNRHATNKKYNSQAGYPRIPRPVTARALVTGAVGYIGGLIAVAFVVGLLLENFKLVMTLAFPGIFLIAFVVGEVLGRAERAKGGKRGTES